MTDLDTSMEPDAVCPYCGFKHDTGNLTDRNAISEESRVISCDECGKDFTVIGSVSWHFSTFKEVQ